MNSPLEPMLRHFFAFMKKLTLEQCHDEFKLVYYKRYVDDIFVLFKS